ncbi:MAG TPA: tetratricopeptide repeat protein [Chitinophagaceae bacterium]
MRRSAFCYLPVILGVLISCNSQPDKPSAEVIASLNLKKGDVITCAPESASFGSVDFLVTARPEVKKDFDQAVAMLHSFEYDEAEKVFAKIIDKDPSVPMAYWGVAMSNFHPLWAPPTEDELKKGSKAVEVARSLSGKTEREAEYIEAIGQFYDNYKDITHKDRCLKYEKAMKVIYDAYPSDKEAAIFYALALNTTANPTDKTYANQRKAGEILNKLYAGEPEHPGLVHYIIHNYDNPELAELGLTAARKYASIAPASAHAQHMPSHIFIRLGLWDESLKSNLASMSSAQCYAKSAGMKGSWDEELHAMDYLMYGYLQKGNIDNAAQQLKHLRDIQQVEPQNFKVAYAFAAIPARFALENRQWKDASNLEFSPAGFEWQKFPWQKGIIHFARLMGKVHTNDIAGATKELEDLKSLNAELIKQKDDYKAKQIEVQMKSGEAWIQMKKGNKAKAIELMTQAANLEDATEKHPVTPGEVMPAREMLGDLYLALNEPAKALAEYEADIKRHPNRFNGLYGAGLASEKAGNDQKAEFYYNKLIAIAGNDSKRSEIADVTGYLKSHSLAYHAAQEAKTK